MSKGKNHILGKIHKALRTIPEEEGPEDVEVSRKYHQKGERTGDEITALFAERVSEYKATVKRVESGEINDVIADSCQREQVDKIAVPDGFPREWLSETFTPLFDKPASPLTNQEMDDSDGVITTCALAIAETGTIILDAGKGQGRRVLTLLPDYHLCIVRESQIVELVPEGFAHFESSVKNERRPITFISGPSATSDIELSRVEGVHGPRRLEVLVIDSG